MVATFRHEKLFVCSILTHQVTVIHLKNVLKRNVIFNKLFYSYVRYFNCFGTVGDTELPLNKVESATDRGVTWGQRKYAQVML
jgi:hypothetical protein